MSGRPEKHKPTAAKKPRTKKRRISKESYFSFLGRRWGKLSVRGWLEVLGVVIVAAVIYGIFFVKRELLEYRPAHSCTVRDPEFFGSAHAAADPVPIGGNRVTLLHNGDGIFPPLLESIRQARRTINFEAFLFHA